MQNNDGSFTMLNGEQIKKEVAKREIAKFTNEVNGVFTNRIIREGQYFKIQHCYFCITKISPEGIEAKGVSREEYFERRDNSL